VVLDDKGVAEMGTHEQLMARDGLYRRLCEIQTLLNESELDVVRRRRQRQASAGRM